MNHRERVLAALHGGEVDRQPVSMWRHFFEDETTPEGLAEAMLAFQRRFDWDFMKVNPRASYHAEAWGQKARYQGDRPPQISEAPVSSPEDWLKLEVLPPDRGVLGEHLRALELIAAGLPSDVPFLMTVFTPLSIVGRLASSEEMVAQHLREHWDEVSHALDVVTETFIQFSRACLDRGASGLFYATTSWATTLRLTEAEYERFGRPHDLKLLAGLPECEFHMLHVCREQNMLRSLADYPVHAFNWDARAEGNLSLAEASSLIGDRPVIGGADHGDGLVDATPRELEREVAGMKVAMGPKGWMLGPGCTFPPEAPEANLHAIRRAVETG